VELGGRRTPTNKPIPDTIPLRQFRYPLRTDVTVSILLPQDITKDEMGKVVAWLRWYKRSPNKEITKWTVNAGLKTALELVMAARTLCAIQGDPLCYHLIAQCQHILSTLDTYALRARVASKLAETLMTIDEAIAEWSSKLRKNGLRLGH